MVVKPNNKEQAKLIINSMKDNGLPARSDINSAENAAVHLHEETATSRSPASPPIYDTKQLHMDPTDDIGLRRSRIHKHVDDEIDESKNNDGVTWRGRINHVSEEQGPDSKHVLSALSEIKNLMTLSMKPPNLKAFDAALPLSSDKYIHTASNVIKKLETAQEKKRRHEPTQENGYIPKVKAMIHENLRNNTYTDDPSDYAYVQKAHEIIAQEPAHHKQCVGAHCRHHVRVHKPCSGIHCRHDIFMAKEDPEADASYAEEFEGKLKGQNTFHSQNGEYGADISTDFSAAPSHKAHHHQPYDAAGDYQNTRISPYHSQGDDEGYPATIYGDEVHHNTVDADEIHGTHNRHNIHDNNDQMFEKDFENKVNDKDYGDTYSANTNGHHVHHMLPNNHNMNDDPAFNDPEYNLGEDNYNSNDHVGGFHPHQDYNTNPYNHDGDMSDMPEHNHMSHHHGGNNGGFHDGYSDSAGGHNREHSHDGTYDFDEAKEIKDEGHDAESNLDSNGKLKDWYKMNAMGIKPSTKLDEPMEGEIVLAANEKLKKEKEAKAVAAAATNSSKIDEKKIESKFEQAGEKPLNSSEAEVAISKLNESLANGLNESTIKAISSFDNNTDLIDANKTTADALNSFNTIKLESLGNDSLNVQKTLEDSDSQNATTKTDLSTDIMNFSNSSDSSNDTKSENGTMTEADLKKKIGAIETKINSSGDLMKKLEELESKMNSSKKHETAKKPEQLNSTERDLLKVNPEDVLPGKSEDEDFIVLPGKQDNNTQRTLNSTTSTAVANKTETVNNSTVAEASNSTDSGSGASIENVYASIGEPEAGALNAYAKEKNASADNKTSSEAATASLVEDKHAEQVRKSSYSLSLPKSLCVR